MLTKLSLNQLYICKSHIGYSRDLYFKLIKDYIFATKVDYFILDVIKSLLNLKLSIWFSFYIAVYSNKMLFIHYTPESFIYTFGLIFKIFGHFTLKTKWRTGTLTNFRRVRKHYRYLYVKYIRDFQIYKKLTFFTYYNKKLAPQLCDFLFIRRLPSFLVILSSKDSDMALKEGFVVRIPSVGFNSNRSLPFGLTFPIISNDFSEETFTYYLFLYKNVLYKSLYYRRLDFFNLLKKELYLNSSITKIFKLKMHIPSTLFFKNFFFCVNTYKYKISMLKNNKHFKKKVAYMFFLKHKRKRYFKFKKFYFFFRKAKKKGSYFLRSILYNNKFNFLLYKKTSIKSFSLSRKIYFINLFFKIFEKKKRRFIKIIENRKQQNKHTVNKSIKSKAKYKLDEKEKNRFKFKYKNSSNRLKRKKKTEKPRSFFKKIYS